MKTYVVNSELDPSHREDSNDRSHAMLLFINKENYLYIISIILLIWSTASDCIKCLIFFFCKRIHKYQIILAEVLT